MTHKALYILFVAVCLIGTIYFCAVNTAVVPVNFFGKVWSVSLALIVAKLYIVGILCGLSVTRLRRREEKSEQKQLEWKAQDAKLAAEIQTDAVKLLEAKIATLETALDKALKRKG